MAVFTNNDMAKLYLNLSGDYEQLKNHSYPRLNQQQIFSELARRVYQAVNAPNSPWYTLPPEEKNKVFRVLYSFCNSLPQFAKLDDEYRRHYFNYATYPVFLQINVYDRHHNYDCYYARHNDFLFTWLMWDAMLNHHNHHGGVDGCCGHNHDHENNGEAWAMLLLILLAVIAAVLTFIALYYLLQKICSNVERLLFNEGWLQATISLASMLAGAAVGAIVGTFLLSTPLMWLAFTAGISNPIGIAITGIVVMTILGAAGVAFISNAIQEYYISKNNPHAADRADPFRIRAELTDEEANKLITKGIDPFEITQAIIAVRHEMAALDKKHSGSNHKKIPSIWARWFTEAGRESDALMNTIRDLREGRLIYVKIGDDKIRNLMHLHGLTDEEKLDLIRKGLNPDSVENALKHVFAQIEKRIAAFRDDSLHYAKPTQDDYLRDQDIFLEKISRLRNGIDRVFELDGFIYTLEYPRMHSHPGAYHHGYSSQQYTDYSNQYQYQHQHTGGAGFFGGQQQAPQYGLQASNEPTLYAYTPSSSLYPNLYGEVAPSAPPMEVPQK
ncbi:hypothetical protein B1207_12285 [Legionella quinlivanii]|uniref:Uncharacterized protein n=1 Tax=Legionella quinlivanii TaxID=45073 RepID=A0A364LHD1_9GAMM|nr:hypothetical protein [Legionella quinlivanii]RAP35469.1 hypothetical protein B1207_12285 [Legionella quinlivanii]